MKSTTQSRIFPRVLAVVAAASLAALAVAMFDSRTKAVDLARSYGPGDVRAVVDRFEATRTPVARLDMDRLPQATRGAELFDVAYTLPTTYLHDREAILALMTFAETCAPPEHEPPSELRKVWAWHAFLCGTTAALPEGFFDRPPFMHPNGESFVALAVASEKKAFRDAGWLTAHAGEMHVAELATLRALGLPMTPEEAVLAELGKAQLERLSGDGMVVEAGALVLVRERGSPESAHRAAFRAYPVNEWHDVALRSPFRATVDADAVGCVLRDGATCWTVDRAGLEARRARDEIVAGTSASLHVASLAALLALAYAGRRRDRQAKAFMLQMLTHELRTPAASLRLAIEGIRPHFARLPEAAQDSFLTMCDDLQHLRRMIDASTRYLQSGDDGVTRKTAAEWIPSVNDWLAATLAPYKDVAIVPLPDDVAMHADTYWLGVCVKNLVDNALRHGAPPVSARLEVHANELSIVVRDGGTLTKNPLRRRFWAREPRREGAGLGLGLGIVATVARDFGGRLVARRDPTTFRLVVRRS